MKRLTILLTSLSLIFALTGSTLILISHLEGEAPTPPLSSEAILSPPVIIILNREDHIAPDKTGPSSEEQANMPIHAPLDIPRIIPIVTSWPLLDGLPYKNKEGHIKIFREVPVPFPVQEDVATADLVQEYVVTADDTVASIARRFNTTAETLIRINQLRNPRVIHRGLVLQLPSEAGIEATIEIEIATTTEVEAVDVEAIEIETAVEAVSEPGPTQSTNGEQIHTVRGGDTLQTIADRYGVTIDALAHYNDIGNQGMIYPSQLLKIPPPSYVAPSPTQLPPSDSGYIWPIDSRTLAQRFYPGHYAIDLLIPNGSNVHAIAAGTVEFSGWHNYGYGYMIIVAHEDGSRSLYAHNSELLLDARSPSCTRRRNRPFR